MIDPELYYVIDQNGNLSLNEKPLNPDKAKKLLQEMRIDASGAVAYEDNLVEAFDEPLVAYSIGKPPSNEDSAVWNILCNYGVQKNFSLSSLSLDEWDRFHGITQEGVPFVLSEAAQDEFFDAVDSFDDEGFSANGKDYVLPDWIGKTASVEADLFWSERYDKNEAPWNLNQPAPAFVETLPLMKLPKSRAIVLGCGAGHDAAFLAQQGHVVTAVDFSEQALAMAKQNYSGLSNIRWLKADIFKLPADLAGQFDLLVEHTCYCAIDPKMRNQLVKVWRQVLQPRGQILGLFFAVSSLAQTGGPPYGGSEWELRKRLDPYFRTLWWRRWRKSPERRRGKELLFLGDSRLASKF